MAPREYIEEIKPNNVERGEWKTVGRELVTKKLCSTRYEHWSHELTAWRPFIIDESNLKVRLLVNETLGSP